MDIRSLGALKKKFIFFLFYWEPLDVSRTAWEGTGTLPISSRRSTYSPVTATVSILYLERQFEPKVRENTGKDLVVNVYDSRVQAAIYIRSLFGCGIGLDTCS